LVWCFPKLLNQTATPQARAKPLPLRLPLVPADPPSEFASPTLAPARMINEVLYCERRM
jgi:hypothetical protein